MRKTITTIVLMAWLILMARLSIVDACLFNNQKTGDNGVGLILNEHVYDALAKALCAFNLDDRGAIGDVRIPMTKQTYIVFEL